LTANLGLDPLTLAAAMNNGYNDDLVASFLPLPMQGDKVYRVWDNPTVGCLAEEHYY
jgi:hypothetical protein